LAPSQAAPLLTATAVAKAYGAVVALTEVELAVEAGEVHALLGENGAGKSTLLQILAGAVTPDAGSVSFGGAPYAPRHPRQARACGVAMIHQELALALDLTVAENVTLGLERRWPGWRGRLGAIDRATRDAVTSAALTRLGQAHLAARTCVRELGPGERQMVEIARALAADARLVILDEPTSSLSASDAARLFVVLRELAAAGVAVLYVSHFLEEVRAVARRFTVLRDGRSVATGRLADVDDDTLVQHMAGRVMGAADIATEAPRARRGHALDSPRLVVEDLTSARLPQPVSFELRRGEVLGLAGLVGAGRTELLRALFGLDALTGGALIVDGQRDRGRSPRERIQQGFGFLSEDRKGEGLMLARSLVENTTLAGLEAFSAARRLGWIDQERRLAAAEALFERLAVRHASPWQPAGTLSGGNQQKLCFARLMFQGATILLLDEPTRGVDVAARTELARLIRALAAEGAAVLMVSSYLPELLRTCDRIAVIRRGVLAPARETADWSEHSLLLAATGAGAAAVQGAH